MKIEAVVDLDDLINDSWGTMVKRVIKKEIEIALKKDPAIKKAIKAIQNEAAKQIIEALKKETE